MLNIINNISSPDSDCLVILPTIFREEALQDTIIKGKLFVAVNENGTIIGYKKLFILDDPEECVSTLKDEIRCIDGNLEECGEHNNGEYAFNQNDTYIYLGSDYTLPPYRGQGVNAALMREAMNLLRDDTIMRVKSKQSPNIILAFGLVNANMSRKHSIIASFVAGISTISDESYNFYAFEAYKPSFDPDATECIPNPNGNSRGQGCIVQIPIKEGAL